jgi:NAD(P)-dependent dehydrogenase (short-subunit alcohol dehydrogenase family)
MEKDLFTLKDRIIVITGGMGQLGQQYAGALMDYGAKVAIVDLQIRKANLNDKLARHSESDFMLLRADVTRRSSLEAALREIKRQWDIPHALVNNAALDSPPDAPAEENGPFENYPESSWNDIMNVNVKGVFLCCQVFGGQMAEARQGSIVNICSVYGLVSPDQRIYTYRRKEGQTFYKPIAYSASKSALLNLTRYLATYWADRNVRVNTITLGGVFNYQDKQFLKGYCARVPLGRMAREDEYNGALIFLLSDASSYMTGSNLVIDGGWTAW